MPTQRVLPPATAPFALLGSLFGGGEEMNLIDFEPGEATLDVTGQERTTAIVKALKERPQLQLEVPSSYSSEADRPVLAARKLDERLLSLAQQQVAGRKRKGADVDATLLADPAERFDLLLAQYRLDFGAKSPLPPAVQSVVDARKKRDDEAAGSGEVDPARIFILGAKQTDAAENRVRLELSLK